MIIGINGYAGSGKDTVGRIIQCLCSDDPWFADNIENALYDWHGNFDNISPWKIKKWAGKLKQVASILSGIPIELFEEQGFKKSELGPEWNDRGLPITVREFLQRLGTDALRNGLHDNTWINALMSDYRCPHCGWADEERPLIDKCDNDKHIVPKWIITDTRFPNEAHAIKKHGGIIIRVNCSKVKPINTHPSETALDSWKFDYVIDNNGSLNDLKDKVQNIIYQYNY